MTLQNVLRFLSGYQNIFILDVSDTAHVEVRLSHISVVVSVTAV